MNQFHWKGISLVRGSWMPLDQGVKKKSLETNKIREHMNTQEVARSTHKLLKKIAKTLRSQRKRSYPKKGSGRTFGWKSFLRTKTKRIYSRNPLDLLRVWRSPWSAHDDRGAMEDGESLLAGLVTRLSLAMRRLLGKSLLETSSPASRVTISDWDSQLFVGW